MPSAATADPIRDLIVHLDRRPDPAQPGRLFYRIVGATREAVQSAINDLTNKVADGFGYAVFTSPTRCEAGYVAQGAVVVYEAADVA
jgi:hypothetical protein